MRETPRDSSSSLTVEPGFAFRKDLWTRAYQVNEYGYLRWSDVSFEDTKSERNITSATGSVAPGQIVSLWGPVDSGVDVLAQILAGRCIDYTGSVENSLASSTFAENVDRFESLFPRTLTMREALEFYFRAIFPGSVIPLTETSIEVGDVVREFGLAGIQYKKCDTLNHNERQLLYLISMILRPEPILILHNVNRHLTNEQCRLIAQRLRLLAETGHTILLISSFPSSTFLELSDYVHVFHLSGKEFYAGPPRNLENYLQRNEVVEIIHRYSNEDLLYCALSIEHKDFEQLAPRVEEPPKGVSVLSTNPSGQKTPCHTLVGLILSRTMTIQVRHPMLLRARLLFFFCFVLICKAFDSPIPGQHASVIVDLLLTYLAGVSLMFGALGSSMIDRVLIQEGSGALKEVYSASAVISARLIFIISCEIVFTYTLCKVFAVWVSFPNELDILQFAGTAIVCSLFYTFLGSFCGLFEEQNFRALIHLMILAFTISAMVILGPVSENETFLRSSNPAFIARNMIFSHSSNTPAIVVKGDFVYGPKKRLLSRKVPFWPMFLMLAGSTALMACLYAMKFCKRLKHDRSCR